MSGLEKQIKPRRRINWAGGLFIAPAAFMLIFVYAIPLLFNLVVSFTDWTGIGWGMKFIGIRNYIDIFTDRVIITVLGNNLQFLVGTVVLQNIFALWLSTWLVRKFWGRNFFRSLFFLPAVIPIVAVAMVFGIFFDPVNGPIVQYAKMLDWDWLASMRFLGNPDIVMNTIIAVNVWQWTGWNMIIYLAGHQSIPNEIYESGVIDGANGWQKFRHLTLPLLAPAITINMVMTTMGALRVFDLPYALTSGGPGYASETFIMSIVRTTFRLSNVGLGAAMSIFLAAVILAITLVQSFFLVKREEAIRD